MEISCRTRHASATPRTISTLAHLPDYTMAETVKSASSEPVPPFDPKGCRYDQDVEALARAAGLRVVRSERFGGGFFGSFELAPAPR